MPDHLPRTAHVAPLSRISRSTAMLRIGLLSLLATVIIFAGLTLQMAMGDDPAIGNGAGQGNSAFAGASPPDRTPSPAPIVDDPVLASPPISAPAPAPAPAPVQTSVS